MLPPDELKFALDIHSRSYKLLRWLGRAIDAGEIPIPRVVSRRHAEDVTAAVMDWIEPFLVSFPGDMRPDAGNLRQFAAFFGTYLTSSYDLVNDSGVVLRNQYGGACFCPICARLVNGSHLKAKKLTSSDKRRSVSLMLDRLVELAQDHGFKLTIREAEVLIAKPEYRIAAAYSTYGYWLIQRKKGATDGPPILALWRQLAWTDAGSPRPNFKLEYDDFQKSEDLLLTLIPELAH
ncbi:MAG TPA: hypothetical protein VFG20_15815 [Planctomycetaceae bacterium]|jgi:hypothetical protein|nr:hypothetical protein [Planctomycetaceae bacterium]